MQGGFKVYFGEGQEEFEEDTADVYKFRVVMSAKLQNGIAEPNSSWQEHAANAPLPRSAVNRLLGEEEEEAPRSTPQTPAKRPRTPARSAESKSESPVMVSPPRRASPRAAPPSSSLGGLSRRPLRGGQGVSADAWRMAVLEAYSTLGSKGLQHNPDLEGAGEFQWQVKLAKMLPKERTPKKLTWHAQANILWTWLQASREQIQQHITHGATNDADKLMGRLLAKRSLDPELISALGEVLAAPEGAPAPDVSHLLRGGNDPQEQQLLQAEFGAGPSHHKKTVPIPEDIDMPEEVLTQQQEQLPAAPDYVERSVVGERSQVPLSVTVHNYRAAYVGDVYMPTEKGEQVSFVGMTLIPLARMQGLGTESRGQPGLASLQALSPPLDTAALALAAVLARSGTPVDIQGSRVSIARGGLWAEVLPHSPPQGAQEQVTANLVVVEKTAQRWGRAPFVNVLNADRLAQPEGPQLAELHWGGEEAPGDPRNALKLLAIMLAAPNAAYWGLLAEPVKSSDILALHRLFKFQRAFALEADMGKKARKPLYHTYAPGHKFMYRPFPTHASLADMARVFISHCMRRTLLQGPE